MAGGTPPHLAPYFAAEAATNSLTVLYARELARWGIKTTIVVPGSFTLGINHFAHSGRPADAARAAEYEVGPYAGFSEQVQKAFAAIVPENADPAPVAAWIIGHAVRPVAVPRALGSDGGRRGCRVHGTGHAAGGDAAAGGVGGFADAGEAGVI